jgi:hypothetical protein
MSSAEEYRKRVEETVRGKWKKGAIKLQFEWHSVPEAKQRLTSVRQMQKELRQIKKEINVEMKAIRARYKAQADRTQPGLVSMFRGRGAQRSSVAGKRRKVREERDRALAPYETLKLGIDNALTQLDGAKLEMQSWIDQHK